MRTDKWVINKEDAAVNKMYWSFDSICEMDLNGQEVDNVMKWLVDRKSCIINSPFYHCLWLFE